MAAEQCYKAEAERKWRSVHSSVLPHHQDVTFDVQSKARGFKTFLVLIRGAIAFSSRPDRGELAVQAKENRVRRAVITGHHLVVSKLKRIHSGGHMKNSVIVADPIQGRLSVGTKSVGPESKSVGYGIDNAFSNRSSDNTSVPE